MTVADLDEDYLGDYDDPDSIGEVIAAEFTDFVAGNRAPSRRELRKAKALLREHPVVDQILAYYPVDDSADIALRAVVEAWGIPVPRKAVRDSQRTPEGTPGRCLWPGCDLPPKERRGARGRRPKHCAAHTHAAKRKADRERLRLKRSGALELRECCRQWQQSGRRAPCRQCRDFEMESRLPYPLTAVEKAYLGAGGFHLV